jgi:hypothetical protein
MLSRCRSRSDGSLTSVSNFFERVDEASSAERASASIALPFFAVARSVNARMLRTNLSRS